MSTSSRLYSGGHQVPMPSVKTENASSIDASTTIDACTEVAAACSLMTPPAFAVQRLPCKRPEPGSKTGPGRRAAQPALQGPPDRCDACLPADRRRDPRL